MRILILICISLLAGSLQGQSFHKKTDVKASVLKKYEKARVLMEQNQLEAALELLEACQGKDPIFYDAFYRAALIQASLQDWEAAERTFKVCLDLAPNYRKDVQANLGYIQMELGNYTSAIQYLEAYLASDIRNENERKSVERVIQNATFLSTVDQDVPFDPQPLIQFNTKKDEYFPSISIDGQEFVFTRRVVLGDALNEDFFIATRDDQGEWTTPEPFTAMNTSLDEGARSIAADGKTVIVTYCNQKGGLGSCDLYSATFSNGKWSNYKNIGAPVNSNSWESQPAIAANGEKLIFCSNRPGGYGGKDLWLTTLDSLGQWTEPVNLGPTINTPYDDKTPFLHPDGSTLYFMSDGHPGFGGFDLFMAHLGSDGNWQEPKNLGSPINSKMDEGLMVVDFQGERAYFATDRPLDSQKKTGKYADYDLYAFELYPDIRPNRAVFVRGKVLDAQTKAPLQAKIELYDLRTAGQAITKFTDTDGSFLFVLEDNREYGVFTQADGYLTASINFNLVDYDEETQDGLELLLTPIAELETNKQNILENVFFESGQATLQTKSILELDLLATLMLENDFRIKIIGHTDDIGDEMDNLALSHARAKAVVDYLVAKGIPESRLGFEGRGELEPIADNTTEEGRRANRRTTFLVLD